ncbi:MAG: hypothetical protein P1V20_22815 [Verrucomicrobiales bacterium]|nr:hypothetical protein [Verrucomicrobiales bacterium]
MHRSLASILALGMIVSCAESPEDIGSPTWPERVPAKLDFKTHVRPILVINCIECHNSEDAVKYSGLNLQTKAAAMTTGKNAPVIIPGNADGSLLIQMLQRDPQHQWAMPPTPDRIWGARLEILRKWINEGADWPTGLVLEHPAEVENW